jgi:hypothetical protein
MKSSYLRRYAAFAVLFVLFISLSSQTFSQDAVSKYSQVRISAKSSSDIKNLANAGLIIDHAVRKPGHYIDAWLSEDEMSMLKRSGVSYSILVDDWQAYYDNLPKMSPAEMDAALKQSADDFNITHSIYGTMGGFLKYDEVVNKLDSMRLQYPNLISQKFSIGTTAEGRSLWTVRVTKNPDAVTGRPQAWYHSLIHAREPESMQHLIYYMYWLFENYNVDPIATYILNNRELYFTPVLNPDGYVYNQTTNPNGGGMWRKNRRNNGGSFGVDVNRNFGTYQFWNAPNGGSSTSPSSDTYRGSAPFSEPESQAAMNFINARNIQTVFGAHTYGNYIIKPLAWQDPLPSPDDAKFNEYLADMSATNNYTTGFPSQTVGYQVRGGADDWYYNDSVHAGHHIMAMTPETGLTGFWPTQAEILPLAQEMLFSDKYMALIAGPFVYPVSAGLNKSIYTQNEAGTYKIRFRNKGVMTANNVKIQLTSPSSYVNLPVTEFSYPSLASFVQDSSAFNFTVSGSAPNNYAIPLVLRIKQDTNTIHTQTHYILIGNGITTFADSAEQTFSNWTTSNTWAITTSQSHTPTHSFTDSPTGSYANNANNSMTLTTPINTSAAPVVYLSFWHRYNVEEDYDFCNLEVSSNNGSTWQKVKSYTGVQSAWTAQSLDITAYSNGTQNLKVRFRLTSDDFTTADGWYVDDIKLTSYNSVVTSIDPNINTPERYSLSQNYPNPFNPSTSIAYAIPVKELVRIKIFDMLGKEIAVLVNEVKQAGSYAVNFDASGLSSGIYYYRLESGSFTETRKMILVK